MNISDTALSVFDRASRFLNRYKKSNGAVVFIIVTSYFLWFGPPLSFEPKHLITIPEGATITEVAAQLDEENVVRSASALTLFSVVMGGSNGVLAGQYVFAERENVISIASRITSGQFGLDPVRVTVFEGLASYEIAELLSSTLDEIDADEFYKKSVKYEGELYPDTYLFLPNVEADFVIDTLRSAHREKIASIQTEVDTAVLPLQDILILASILEREARTDEEMRMISGILQNRLNIGMPLQVDAVFGYIHSTGTFNPTFDDLEVDSPYNTYKNKGLPPGPIGNPGLRSIQAVINPIESNYLYYLTGRDKITRYSVDFDGHLENRRLYLD